MKRFKLVREYPGSPNIGDVAESREHDYIINNPHHQPLSRQMIENYPEFWEEVKEEFPKIISFRNTTNDIIFHICEDGFYTSCSLDYKIGTFNEEHFLKESYFEIYQVAVSETEVFTLGDKVEIIMNRPKYSKSTINRFELEANGCISVRVCEYCSVSLHDIKKAPEVLFATEDGVEIFEGDSYFRVRLDTLEILKSNENWVSSLKLIKYFSTKEAAEKYIDENKSIYSKKQIKEAIESSFVRETYILDTPYCHIDKFKEDIFKQKLGL